MDMDPKKVKKRIRVKFLDTAVEEQKTAYVFKVSNLQQSSFIIQDRFSNFKKLHQSLKKNEKGYSKDKNIKFPERNVFTTDFLERRCQGLEYFLSEIFNNEQYLQSQTVKMYLSMYWNDAEGINYQYDYLKPDQVEYDSQGNVKTIKNSPTLQKLRDQKYLNDSMSSAGYQKQNQGAKTGVMSYFGNTASEQFTRAGIAGAVVVCGCCCTCWCCCCI